MQGPVCSAGEVTGATPWLAASGLEMKSCCKYFLSGLSHTEINEASGEVCIGRTLAARG